MLLVLPTREGVGGIKTYRCNGRAVGDYCNKHNNSQFCKLEEILNLKSKCSQKTNAVK